MSSAEYETALRGGGLPSGKDIPPELELAHFIGSVQRAERGQDDSLASLMAGTEHDAFIQPDGRLVVRYSEAPSLPGPRSALDYVLERSTAHVDGFRAAVMAAANGNRDFEALERIVRKTPRQEFTFETSPTEPGVIGVLRMRPTDDLVRMLEDNVADANADLDALSDDKYVVVDGLGRPRRLTPSALGRADTRVKCRTLAYYAALLGRHARLVAAARAATKMCVEGSELDHGPVAVPSRIFVPRNP